MGYEKEEAPHQVHNAWISRRTRLDYGHYSGIVTQAPDRTSLPLASPDSAGHDDQEELLTRDVNTTPLDRPMKLKPLPYIGERTSPPPTRGIRSNCRFREAGNKASAQCKPIPILQEQIPPPKVGAESTVKPYPVIQLSHSGRQVNHPPQKCSTSPYHAARVL